MEVKDFHKKIIEFTSKWDEKRETTASKQKTFTHLIEEIGELARQYVNEEIRKDKYNEKEVEDAIGDIFIQLVKLAYLHKLDIEDVVLKLIEEEQRLLD